MGSYLKGVDVHEYLACLGKNVLAQATFGTLKGTHNLEQPEHIEFVEDVESYAKPTGSAGGGASSWDQPQHTSSDCKITSDSGWDAAETGGNGLNGNCASAWDVTTDTSLDVQADTNLGWGSENVTQEPAVSSRDSKWSGPTNATPSDDAGWGTTDSGAENNKRNDFGSGWAASPSHDTGWGATDSGAADDNTNDPGSAWAASDNQQDGKNEFNFTSKNNRSSNDGWNTDRSKYQPRKNFSIDKTGSAEGNDISERRSGRFGPSGSNQIPLGKRRWNAVQKSAEDDAAPCKAVRFDHNGLGGSDGGWNVAETGSDGSNGNCRSGWDAMDGRTDTSLDAKVAANLAWDSENVIPKNAVRSHIGWGTMDTGTDNDEATPNDDTGWGTVDSGDGKDKATPNDDTGWGTMDSGDGNDNATPNDDTGWGTVVSGDGKDKAAPNDDTGWGTIDSGGIDSGWAAFDSQHDGKGGIHFTTKDSHSSDDGWNTNRIKDGPLMGKRDERPRRSFDKSTSAEGNDMSGRRSGKYGPSGSNQIPLGKRRWNAAQQSTQNDSAPLKPVSSAEEGWGGQNEAEVQGEEAPGNWNSSAEHDTSTEHNWKSPIPSTPEKGGRGTRNTCFLQNRRRSAYHQLRNALSLPELCEVSELHQLMNQILHCSDYGDGDRLKGEHEPEVRNKVLLYHPQKDIKLAGGVDYLIIDKHPDHDARCFFVVHSDGSKTDFSYWKCLEGLVRTKYPELAKEIFVEATEGVHVQKDSWP